ncbi:MAG: SH3 domain-containing protein [Proteobacteria bacterium]|nr:SH3 domain-containing protein [Pseudomonadota bacterium]MBU4384511.1 SH3 domain-containing protein [Pseudomonadota bacterium]MCG2766341.1 SH3 domain-containing protein [Desulfarculaceae bacterium]
MLPKKRTGTLRWAGRLGCLVLSCALVLPSVALARDYQPERGRNTQVAPQMPREADQGRNLQVAPQMSHEAYRGNNPQVVPRMPSGHREYVHNGARYYYHGGVYYRPYDRGYIVVRPPRGLFVQILPIGFATVMVGGVAYYTYADVYYLPGPGGYVVVDAPPGVVVTSPPPPPVAAPSAPQGTAVVTAPLLNVRTGPGENYPVITTVGQGYSLTIYGQSSGWLYVQAPSGQFGWVDQRFTNIPVSPTPSG